MVRGQRRTRRKMRSALVTILIVLQHVAQFPCRSVTRGALGPLRAPPASQEDLESIITRNREITDLLIPLLEANLEAKRQDQNKRKDLLKVFPYRDAKPIKDPLVDLLPLIKRKSTGKAPLALILASELRSQKNKKGKSKVHARKAFLIENEDKDYSSEADEDITRSGKDQSTLNEDSIEKDDPNKSKEDYDTDIGSQHIKQITFNKNIENKNAVEVSESKSSEADHDTVSKRKYKNQLNLNNSNENKNTIEVTSFDKSYDIHNKIKNKNKLLFNKSNENTLEDSESNSTEVKDDINITSEDKHATNNDHTKEIQVENGNVTEDKKEVVQQKNNKRKKRVRSNIKPVESNDDREEEKKIEVNNQSNEKVEDQASEDGENNSERHKTIPHSYENSVNVADNSNEQIHEIKQKYQTLDTDSYKVSKELVVIDVSKELARHGKRVKVSKHRHNYYDYNSTSEENQNNKVYYSDSDESNETSEKYYSEENSVSTENENHTYDVDISDQSSDSSINTSEENKTSEDPDEEVENQYNEYIPNDNSISESDQYISDYQDVSDYHESIKNRPYKQVYNDYEENYAIEEIDQSASYEDVLDGENYNSLYDEYEDESYSEDDYIENDTTYVETEDDIETGMTVESFEDDTPVIDDDSYPDEWSDDGGGDYESIESRKANSKESIDIKKQPTFSQEIADKYANDSKYTVEDDHSFVESSGELSKFDAESVEGLIEVLQQDLEIKEHECEDKENHENAPDIKHSAHDVHKSYKLSFKFNK